MDLVALYRDGQSWMKKENSVLGITSYQIAVTNMLEEAGIYPDAYLGHSLGEVAAGYVSYGVDPRTGGRLRMQTEEQTIHIAHVRSTLSAMIWTDHLILQTPVVYPTYRTARQGTTVDAGSSDNYYYLPRGTDHSCIIGQERLFDLQGEMAAVGLPVATIQEHITHLGLTDTVVACQNSPKGQTVSGSKTEMTRLRTSLLETYPALFWHIIPTDNVAYHAPHLMCHYEYICQQMSTILGAPDSVALPAAWISTCGTSDVYDASYHANNIVNPVYFQTAIERLPPGTTILEVGPSSSLLGLVKRIRTDVSTLAIVSVGKPATETV